MTKDNGGQAFPVPCMVTICEKCDQATKTCLSSSGMSIWDYFMAHAAEPTTIQVSLEMQKDVQRAKVDDRFIGRERNEMVAHLKSESVFAILALRKKRFGGD